MDRPDTREWLSTNGLGGYASGTACGANTRRYHGLLVAALEPPGQRMVLLSRLDETVIVGGGVYELGATSGTLGLRRRGDTVISSHSRQARCRLGVPGRTGSPDQVGCLS